MICIIRGEPSAVPKRWVGMISVVDERCLLPLAGRPILDHVIERARPQISSLILCHGGDPSPLMRLGLPVVAPGFGGFAAAVLAALDWTATHSRETPWLATFAAPVPFFPTDLVDRLGHAVGAEGADMAWAVSGGRSLPQFGLWPVRLRRDLRRALVKQPELDLEAWAERFRPARVEFPLESEPFVTVRGPEEGSSVATCLRSGADGSIPR